MPTYKLYYFKGPGRAEVTRILFTLAGQEFQDNRIAGEEWQKYKPTTPMGQMPVLEVDDVKICQSHAISRFVAKKFGYAGKTDLDQARVDMIVDCLLDIAQGLIPAMSSSKSEEEKTAIKTKFQEELYPEFMGKMEKILKLNKGGDGWLVGDDITWADVEFHVVVDFPKFMGIDCSLDKWEKLNALKKRIEAHPKVVEWNNKKPKPQ